MSLLNLPIYGKPMTHNEDKYVDTSDWEMEGSELGFSGGMPSSLIANIGAARPTYPQEVIFSCPNKHVRICAPLGGKLKLSSSSEWEEMFGGGIASVAGGAIGTVNNALQWTKGVTLQQPWMNRKIYKNTKPFTFTLPLTFVTPVGKDPIDWVAKPTIALLSLLYPRKGGASLNDITSEAGFNAAEHKDSVAGAIVNMCETYFIPGPSLRATSDTASDNDRGDYVAIMAGNMFNFGLCYINSVDIEYSDGFDPYGIPLAATVNVQATSQDAVYCEPSGEFNVRSLGNNAQNLSDLIDATQRTGKHLMKNISTLFKDTAGFYNGTSSSGGTT